MDDDTLMRQVAIGDKAAFGQIVRRHQGVLIRFARRILSGDDECANDAVQEAFLRLWTARVGYRQEGCLRSYLFRIVRNVCLDQTRRSRPICQLSTEVENATPTGTTMEEDYQSAALLEAVRNAVKNLPEAERVVFVLSQYEQLSYKEIAEIMGCPVGTVASRKRLAVEKLRRKLAAWMDGHHEL